jgi:hypothetical protein
MFRNIILRKGLGSKVNVKVKVSLFLTKHHAMKTYWGMEVQGCIQNFPDWPPGARSANGTALCH